VNNKIRMFGVAILILTLITAVVLGIAAGPANPVTWILVALLAFLPLIHKKWTSRQYIKWKQEYSVGIDSIDQQHKKLLGLINQLQTAVDFSTGEQFEREALDQLIDYTKTHFIYEEGLMEQNAYPDFESHKIQHEKMISRVGEVLAEYEKDQDTAMKNAVIYLKDWLIKHINGTDKAYSSFLISKGVK
jgi:hemerythrin